MTANDNRHVITVADPAALAATAAEHLLARTAANSGRVAICLTGGSSPKQLYQLLATDAYRSRIPWERVHWFIGDERFVPASDPLNNMGMARAAFLERCAPALSRPDANVTGLHVYTFNQVAETERWRTEYLERLAPVR